MERSPESLKYLLDDLDRSWPHTKGNSMFLVRMYHKSQVKLKEETLKAYLELYPYTSAVEMAKMELSYSVHFGLLVVVEWMKIHNPAFVSQFLSRIIYIAKDYNVRKLARQLFDQTLEQV